VWAPEPVWTLAKKEKSLPLPGIEPQPSNPLKYDFNYEVNIKFHPIHRLINFTETSVKLPCKVKHLSNQLATTVHKREGQMNERDGKKVKTGRNK
jgi:hypothetical protein